MSIERTVAVVTDSGSSMRPEDKKVQELGVTIVPLEIRFYENGQYVPYADLNITPEEFYQRMRQSEKLPQTSGAVVGRIAETYKRLSKETNSAISIHITSKHSVAWESAVAGAKIAQEEIPGALAIEVIDSRQLSLGTWLLTERAALLSQKGASLEQIKAEVLAMSPQVQLLVVLETFENLKKGGRANDVVQAYFASLLRIYPILGLQEGKLARLETTRSARKSRGRMVEMVGDSGKLVKVELLHTNAPEVAGEIKEALGKIYQGEIPVHDAGPVLGVHAGEGAVGVVFQKA